VEVPTLLLLQEPSTGEERPEWRELYGHGAGRSIWSVALLSWFSRSKASNIMKSKWGIGSINMKMGNLISSRGWLPKGYPEKWGVDFFDTYAPTTRHATLSSILALQVQVKGLHVHAMDVDQAFLQGRGR